MTFRASGNPELGLPDFQLYDVDTTPQVQVGTLARAVDDAGVLGVGEFIYLKASVAFLLGQAGVYECGPNASSALAVSGTHANKGRTVCVALTDVALGSYGWFQIGGCTVVKALAAADGAIVMISATAGSLSSGVIAGCQVNNAVFSGALNTPSAGFAYVTLNRSSIQTQIT